MSAFRPPEPRATGVFSKRKLWHLYGGLYQIVTLIFVAHTRAKKLK